jgi:YidC/Oxa1 family membrane protein insertase
MMDEQQQQQRTHIALMLVMVMTLGFMYWSGTQAPPPSATSADGGVELAADAGTVAPAVIATQPDAPQPSGEAQAVPPPEPRTLSRARDNTRFVLGNVGAGILSAELQGPKMREQAQVSIAEGYGRLVGKSVPPPPQMNVAQPVPGASPPLALELRSGTDVVLPASTVYRVEESGDVVSFYAAARGLEVTKRLSGFSKEGFGLQLEVEFRNTGAAPWSGEYSLAWSRSVDPRFEEAPSMFGSVGNQSAVACHVGKDFHKVMPKDDAAPESFSGPVNFFGVDQQYFLAALYPTGGARDGRCTVDARPTTRTATAFFPLALAPGQVVRETFGVYLGPKDVEDLRAVQPAPAFHPPLEQTVDFGIWAVLCNGLLWLLKTFHGLFKSWGVAVILITVLVKVLLIPLTHKSMVAAENMKRLQPKMEAVKAKYPEDRERQNVEMMKLYQEEKVNPLGGCLPMLVQMPVWIALFTTLRNSYELYQEPFFSPIFSDLTAKDPTYLLPLLLGVTMVVTQMLQPQMMDAAQARMMTWFMPIFFTVIMLNYPAGLTLYIFTNNVLSILQQWALKKYLERNPTGGAA